MCKDLYAENYKTPVKEIKGDLNRDVHYVHGLEVSIV